jgi:beta-N-acetylhexosaminidase
MQALGGTIPERAARAHAAGCDIILNCWAKMADMEGICNVLPAISEATAVRLDRALAPTRIAPAIAPEQAELLAKRDALLALAGTAA